MGRKLFDTSKLEYGKDFSFVVVAVVHYTSLARVVIGRSLSILTMGFCCSTFCPSTDFYLRLYLLNAWIFWYIVAKSTKRGECYLETWNTLTLRMYNMCLCKYGWYATT